MTAGLTRKTFAAGILGFASGLPFVFLTGSLAAWFTDLGLSMTAIGLLSSLTLAYGFKLLWAPLVRSAFYRWMALCQFGLALTFAALAGIEPQAALNVFALIGFAAALLSATHDTAFEAWRIRAADAATPVELIMTASQIGGRAAVVVAGAGALWLSALIGWNSVALGLSGLFAAVGILILVWPVMRAEDWPKPAPAVGLDNRAGRQLVAIACVLAGLAGAMWLVVDFIASLSARPGFQQAQVEAFTMVNGPLIIALVTIVPILASRLDRNDAPFPAWWSPGPRLAARITETYEAVVMPFGELLDRFGGRILLLLLFVAVYTLSWFSWAGFTMPLYLRELGYSKPEVAVAARLYGSVPTTLGILIGGIALIRLPRRNALLLGALVPLIANGVYIDLAQGGAGLGMVVDRIAACLPERLAGQVNHLGPLYLAITLKNVPSGMASAIFVGFLASLVNRRHAAVQCAIFSSLSFVIGTIASAMAGSLIDELGFAQMLVYVSAFTVLAAILSIQFARAPGSAPTTEPRGTAVR